MSNKNIKELFGALAPSAAQKEKARAGFQVYADRFDRAGDIFRGVFRGGFDVCLDFRQGAHIKGPGGDRKFHV